MQVEHTFNEKRVLESIHFPFVVFLQYCFKDNSYVYIILPFINGGEMFTHLRKMGKFDESLSRFYAAQVALVLEYLHKCNLVYRDLKPENILIDQSGYIRVTDFGFCKLIDNREDGENNFYLCHISTQMLNVTIPFIYKEFKKYFLI
jgi:protein kinase A